jgi:AcrR family transcriptional regulator
MLNPQSQNYHHGNVKSDLISAAMRLLETDNIEQISLRRLAKEIGISPAAVYNHFDDKQALMVAIKSEVFQELNEYFDRECADNANPELAFKEMCFAYYNFSQRYPSRFRVLFSGEISRKNITDDFLRLSCVTIDRLRNIMTDLFEKYKKDFTQEQCVNQATLAWSQLHGLILLRDSGSISAAIASKGWPASCSLHKENEIPGLIETMADGIVSLIKD